jgi:hypothetical protein
MRAAHLLNCNHGTMEHMKQWNRIAVTLLFSGLLYACSGSAAKSGRRENKKEEARGSDTARLKFRVEPAAAWTALFDRNSGWFGGDGIFSIPCNGIDTAGGSDSTLFVFSDTVIGDVPDDSLQPGWHMVHNTVAYLVGHEPLPGKLKFYWDKDKRGRPVSMFTPHTPASSDSDYYWLGDGFVNKALHGNTYIFAYRIRNVGKGAFGFKEMGTVLIVLPAGSRPPFKGQRQMDTPLFLSDGNGSFGAGVFVNTAKAGAPDPDGYVYIYGVKGPKKEVLVARVKPEDFELFARWRYWDGRGWSRDIEDAAAIAARASNELSVTPLPGGRYALVFQTDGIGSTVGLRLGSSPAGPFGPLIQIWKCPELKHKPHYYTYNAKAHPGLSTGGGLLVSYNVNSFDFFKQIQKDPHLYRPRFIRITFQ